jgi:hypothetical protein
MMKSKNKGQDSTKVEVIAVDLNESYFGGCTAHANPSKMGVETRSRKRGYR